LPNWALPKKDRESNNVVNKYLIVLLNT
jgi:hypothetical protein